MKKITALTPFIGILILSSCGPAAENKEVMHQRAKVFQDSIANMIRSSMAEAEAPANAVAVPVQTPTAAPANTVK